MAATAHLLRKRLFEEITIQQVVHRAEASVGAFYNLFPNKEALLPALYARHCDDICSETDRVIDSLSDPRLPLSFVTRTIVATVVDMHRRQRGLLRALTLRAHTHPPNHHRERPHEMTLILPRTAELIYKHRAECNCRYPRQTALLGLLMCLASVREIFLYPDTTAYVLRTTDNKLVDDLNRAWLGMLGYRKGDER